jgi:hypothetical protein
VMARWHTDENYVDARGRPLSLPVFGSGKSITSLIACEFNRAAPTDIVRILQSLVRAGAVRRHRGHFIAINRSVSFAEDPCLAKAYSLETFRRYLRTVQHNISTDDPERRLFERGTSNASIPAKALPDLHALFKTQGEKFLFHVDRIVREHQSDRGPRTNLSLNAFASEDPFLSGRLGRKRRRRRGAGTTR